MRIIDPKTTPTRDFHQFLLGAVAPRPIAFVSTLDTSGRSNLAPYSFYNAFSSNPPILVFSSNRRVVDNTTKDTLHNILQTRECVINAVTYPIVRQMTISSVQFDAGVSEFEKSGLTPIPSDLVKPFRVKESPVQMECKVKEVQTLGTHGGAGHLIICEVVRMHISTDILDENDRIDPHKIDLMGRLGRAYYVRCSGDAIHTIVQPVTQMVIGYDALPDYVKRSQILTANDIAMLSGLPKWPEPSDIIDVKSLKEVQELLENSRAIVQDLERLAQTYLQKEERRLAAAILALQEQFSKS